ncbi:unnamed protein product, partial [Vitis vinifera]
MVAFSARFWPFSLLIDIHLQRLRVCENEKPAEMISFASSALSVLDNAELSITETENSSVIHMDGAYWMPLQNRKEFYAAELSARSRYAFI